MTEDTKIDIVDPQTAKEIDEAFKAQVAEAKEKFLSTIEHGPKDMFDAVQRIVQLEHIIDDLSRSVEIAQYTKQYNVTEVFIRDAEEALKERIVVPFADQSQTKFTIVEGKITDETQDALTKHVAERANQATGHA